MSVNLISAIVALLVIFNSSAVKGEKIECKYDEYNYWVIGQTYQCYVQNVDIFTNARTTVDSVAGQHQNGKTNNDVKGVWIENAENLQYFPNNINQTFPNLIAITIFGTQLKEISQNDLKHFPKLEYLNLGNNDIKIIDQNVFANNRNLKVIYLHINQINHISPTTFDGLNQLEILYLKNINCSLQNSEAYTRSEVLSLIEEINRGACTSNEVTTTTQRTPTPAETEIENLKAKNEENLRKIETLN